MRAMWLKKMYLSCILCLLSFVSFSQNTSGEPGRTIDSLKLALKNATHDTIRCTILNSMIEAESDNKIWPKYNEQLKTLAEKNAALGGGLKNFYLKHIAATLNNIGYNYNNQGDIPKALEYYQKSLKIREEIGDKHGVANSLDNIGVVYDNQGDIPKALEYFHKSLKIQEAIGDKQGMAASLNNIGFIYNFQRDYTKSLEYYLKSLKIREKIGDKNGIAQSLNNIGNIYNNQGNFRKALDYYQMSLKIREEIGYKSGIANSYNNIGLIYDNQGDPTVTTSREEVLKSGIVKALEYYHKSLKIHEEIEDKQGIAYSLNNISNLLIKKGQAKEAVVFANKGMQIAKELGYPENIKRAATTLKAIFKKQNKYKETFEMYELEIKMRDSITNEENNKASIKKQMQYTYEKKELETKAAQDKKDVIAKAELKQKENERNYFIAGFVLVAILALYILRGYKQKQNANAIILEQKNLVEEKQKEIVDSINYAKRIQMALLPSEKYIERNLKKLNTHEGK